SIHLRVDSESGFGWTSRMNPKICSFNGVALGLGLVFAAASGCADVKLHGLFSDNMILQQGATVQVWGWTDEGEEVTVQFRVQKALQVPVGVIHTSWGGSPAEVWMSEQVLSSNASYKQEILDGYTVAFKKSQDAIAQYEKDAAEAKQAGKTFNQRRPGNPWKPA